MNHFFIFLSFSIVAFAQPAWISYFGPLASLFGFTLFWKGMLSLQKRKSRFFLSWIWFSLIQGVQLSWLCTTDYMGIGIIVLYLFLILAVGLQFAFLSSMIQKKISWSQVFAFSGAWVFFEWIRLFFLCGFTWNQVGLALSCNHYSLQFASLFGIFGLSFWVILVNLTFLKAWIEKRSVLGVIWIALALIPYLYGVCFPIWAEKHAENKSIRVALVQTDLKPEEKEFYASREKAYIPPLVQWENILNSLKTIEKADLIVFPEAAIPHSAHTAKYLLASGFDFFKKESIPPLRKPYAVLDYGIWKVSNMFFLQAIANEYQAHVICGVDDRDIFGKYNAAFHFKTQSYQHERYEKQILVPVGEYIPLKKWSWLSKFIGEHFGIYGSFDWGEENKVFQSCVPVGISICLEETFTHILREARKKGAEVFVSISNDAWFPRSKLAKQHLDHGKIRAVENGVSMLRSCNSGITCAIDPYGRVIKMAHPIELASAVSFSMPLKFFSTPYTLWGDRAILFISMLSMLSSLFFLRKKLL